MLDIKGNRYNFKTLETRPRKFHWLAISVGVICLLAVYVERHREGRTGRIDNLLVSFLGGFQEQVNHGGRGMSTLWDRYLWLVNTEKTNEGLLRRLAQLEVELARSREIEDENDRLMGLLELRKEKPKEFMAAHVIGHDATADFVGVRVDRGSRDNVQVGMGVIAPSGVVGRVWRVADSYSDVLTLLDPNSNVDVVVSRSRARGIVSGVAGSREIAQLKYIDRLEDIVEGDTLVSSGFGHIFPAGLLVGYVGSAKQNGIVKDVVVRASVNIYRLEEVLIVVPPSEPKKNT